MKSTPKVELVLQIVTISATVYFLFFVLKDAKERNCSPTMRVIKEGSP